jgi:hypothetical protein
MGADKHGSRAPEPVDDSMHADSTIVSTSDRDNGYLSAVSRVPSPRHRRIGGRRFRLPTLRVLHMRPPTVRSCGEELACESRQAR